MSDDHLNIDDKLLWRIAEGDEIAIKVLFKLYYPRLYYYALKVTKNASEAEDQAQEALLTFWENKSKFTHANLKDAEAFMFTVVRNKALNYLKHIKMKGEKGSAILLNQDLTDSMLDAQIIQEDIFYRVYKEINQLPIKQKALLKMIYVDGLETNEIAVKLNTTTNNIRNQKARALDRLRDLLLQKGLIPSIFYFLFFVMF